MDQVYRIEIPVEVTNATDTSALRNLETTLQRIFTTAAQGKGTLSSAIQSANAVAASATSSLKNMESAVKQAGDSFDDAGSSAQEMGGDAKSAADGAEGAADKLEGSVEEVGDAYQETGNDAQQAGSQAGSAFNNAGSSVDKFTQRVEKSNKTLRQMFKEKISLIMNAIDKASPVLKNIWNSAKNLAGKAWSVAVRMKDMITAPFRKLKSMIMSPITIALSIAGVSMGAGDMISTYTDFTTGMSAVKALTGATDEEFKRLNATAQELGATTKFTAAQAAEGMQYLGMAGWDTNQIIDAMPGLLDLAAAGATDLGTAADIVSDVMTAMGMSADQASTAADIFARTATMTNTTISGMGESLKYAAPIAHSFGLSLSEVSTMVGMMGNAGIKASQAGTAIRSSLLSMASPSKEAATLMKQLGLSFSNADGSMKSMGTIVGDLQTAFKGLTAEQRLNYAETLFGTMASSAWLGMIDQGADEYNRLYAAIDGSAGAAKEMAEIQMDNLQGDFTKLQSAVDGMKISLMEKLNPYLRKGVQWLTEKIPDLTEKVGGLIDRTIEKGKSLFDFLSGVFNSSEFQNADGFAEKFFVAWDKIVAEPFAEWWNGDGKSKVTGIMSDVGGQIGELLHGIIMGVWAAIKGEDIDFEGMNISGIAQAGAEAAKSFVSSFASSLNLGEIISEAPGGLKALAGGFLGIKVGGGVISAIKTFGQLKLAFGGVATSAATASGAASSVGASAVTAAAGAGKATAILGGLKTALAAIPVWGWVAAAAIAAVGIGIKLYSDAQERERQNILHLGDDAEKAAKQYKQSARNVKEAADTIDGIHTLELQIKEGKNNTETIAKIQADLDIVKDREAYIKLLLAGASMSKDEIAGYKKELDGIKSKKAEIEAKLANGTLTEEQITEYQQTLNALEGREVELEAILAGASLTPEQIAAYQAELDTLHGKEVELTAKLAESRARASDVTAYMQELVGLKGREETIKMTLEKGVTGEEAAEYMKELEIIQSRKETIYLKLNGLAVTSLGIMYAESLINGINGKKAEAEVLLKRSGLSKDDITAIQSELASIETRKAELEVTMSGAGLSTAEVKAMKDELAGITSRTAEIEAKMAKGGLTEQQIADLSAEYNALQTRSAELTLKLAGASMTDEQLQALAAEYAGIQSKEAEITAKMSASGMKEADIQKVFDLYNGIGNKTAELTVKFSTESLTGEDLQTAADNLDRMYERLAEMSGGAFTAGDIKNGYVTTEEAQKIIEKRADINLLKLQAEVEEARSKVGKGVEARDRYKTAADSAAASEAAAHQKIVDLNGLETERLRLNAERDLMYGRMRRGEMSAEDYLTWRDETYKPGIWGLQDQYEEITGYNIPPAFNYLENAEEGSDPFNTVNFADNEAWYRKEKEKAQADYATQDESLVKLYQSEKTLMEGQTFNGSALAGYSLEELAANYTALDDAGRQLFQDAVMALQTLNAQTDYIGEDQKTSALSVVELAQKTEVMQGIQQQVQSIANNYSTMTTEQQETFKASEEGAKQLATVNSALESLGIDAKVESLDELQAALDAIGAVDLEALQSLDLAAVQAAFAAVSGDASGMKTSLDEARAALQALDGKSATTTVTNNTYNNTYNTTYDRTGGAAENAEGGIYNGAFLSWVAEDGPEAIIPLSSARRNRGYDLWLQAGKMLGVSEYAEGGILSPYAQALGNLPDEVWVDADDDGGNPKPIPSGNGGGNSFSITVSANPTFTIEGGNSPDDILSMLKSKQKELVELLGSAFADELEDIVSNMV